MPIPKKYLHDKLVLLLLSVLGFLILLCTLLILFRLDSSKEAYIIQYRSNLGLDRYLAGSTLAILSFIAFSVLVGVIHIALSIRVYRFRRDIAVMTLGLGILLVVMTIIVSNSLLVLG